LAGQFAAYQAGSVTGKRLLYARVQKLANSPPRDAPTTGVTHSPSTPPSMIYLPFRGNFFFVRIAATPN
jgi:hypothetical protein